MSTNITLKRSAVQNKVPLTTDLALGEIALNTYDGKLFLKKNVSGTESIIGFSEVYSNANNSIVQIGQSANTGGIIQFFTEGTEKARLAANGNFGIGVTAPSSKLDLAETWNNAGTTFTHIKSNVTDTASNAASLLMNLQVGGASKFSVTKAGVIIMPWASQPFIWNTQAGFGANGDNALIFTGGGTKAVISSGGITSFSFNLGSNLYDPDIRIERDASNTLAQRNGTNAQTSRIYGTYTDASNYERAKIGWNTNVLEIGTENAGTGTLRNINLIGGNVGIGVTPTAKLDVAGDIRVNSSVTLSSEAITLATVTKTQVASFAVASFRSGKLVVQAYNSVTGEVQISELLVAHNGTTASATEYGVVFTGSLSFVTYDVDILSGNVRLMVTNTTANSTQYKISETLMVA